MKSTVWRFGLIGVFLAAVCLPALGEVSTDILPGGAVQIVVLGSTEGPDPFGMSWQPYRDIPAFRMLNPDGEARGDGRPDIALPPTGPYVVSWAWNAGSDHDIAVAQWTAEGWGPPLFLTAGPEDDLDPRLLVADNGILHLVWWTRENQAIRFSTLLNDSNFWAVPSNVTTPEERGRRPSVAIWNDTIHVALERDSSQPDMAQEVVVKVRNPNGTFSDTTAARTRRIDRLDPVLHSESGWMWMDWKQGDDQFAFVVNGGEGWSEPVTVPWADPSWIGVENVRQQIRQIVMALGEAPIVSAGHKGDGGLPPRQPPVVGGQSGHGIVSVPGYSNVN